MRGWYSAAFNEKTDNGKTQKIEWGFYDLPY